MYIEQTLNIRKAKSCACGAGPLTLDLDARILRDPLKGPCGEWRHHGIYRLQRLIAGGSIEAFLLCWAARAEARD